MKLKTLDQIHISSVKADSLMPGEKFSVSASLGKELMKKHPGKFIDLDAEKAADDQPAAEEQEQDVTDKSEKAETAPKNKAEDAPANKAETGSKSK
jgi:hypothetical protein